MEIVYCEDCKCYVKRILISNSDKRAVDAIQAAIKHYGTDKLDIKVYELDCDCNKQVLLDIDEL